MWKFVGPLIMIVIFFSSVFREIKDPLKYTVYKNVCGSEGIHSHACFFSSRSNVHKVELNVSTRPSLKFSGAST